MGEHADEVPFQAHVELLRTFLDHRNQIVERIQDLLNAQRKSVGFLQDRPLLSRHFEDCFFTLPAVTADQSRLRRQLDEAHWSSGFRPRRVAGLYNDLIHPAEMMIRGFYCWRQTRWPGRNGRLRYAQTLFNVYLLRCLELLSMRLWDRGSDDAGDRLAQVQAVLDELWKSAPADQPVLVRDARWLIPLAQSPTTDELAAYLEVAERIAESLEENDRLEIRKAHVAMIAGHLRSQIRHYCLNDGVSLEDPSVVLRTRTSNALDFALLVQALVPLLEAYEHVLQGGGGRTRRELAGAILQGISPDPEVFLNRLDLLAPYSMIEYLFIATDRDGRAGYTPMGQRHLGLLREYQALIGRLSKPLHEDCPQFRPAEGAYSPYGAIFGTPSNLTEDMALKTLERDIETRFSLEDVFADGDGDAGSDKLAWVNGWRKLPHVDPQVQRLYEYPQQFAEDVFDRIGQALERAASADETGDGSETGRLFVVREDDPATDSKAPATPALPIRYVRSSDKRTVAAGQADFHDQTRLKRDRQEGYFVLSYETSVGWLAITKDFLTEVLGAGHDAKIVGLPAEAAGVLSLMCPGMVVAEDLSDQASVPPSMSKD